MSRRSRTPRAAAASPAPHGGTPTVPFRSALGAEAATAPRPTRPFDPATIPPSLRLQDYQVYLGVRVKDEDALSKATVQAMRWTRSARRLRRAGLLRHRGLEDAASPTSSCACRSARCRTRSRSFSSLGTLQSQHVSVTDLQGQVNAQTKRIIVLSRRIQAIVKRLQAGGLSVDQEAQLRAELAADRAELAAVTQSKAAHRPAGPALPHPARADDAQGSVVAPPSKPGRFGQRSTTPAACSRRRPRSCSTRCRRRPAGPARARSLARRPRRPPPLRRAAARALLAGEASPSGSGRTMRWSRGVGSVPDLRTGAP